MEIRSVKDKPFYCQFSVGTILFQGRVFTSGKRSVCLQIVSTMAFIKNHMHARSLAEEMLRHGSEYCT